MRDRAIPPHRDRLQSAAVVWVGLPLLVYLALDALVRTGLPSDMRSWYIGWIALIAVAFACIVWRLRAATPVASLCGGVICFLVTLGSGGLRNDSPLRSELSPLMLLFVLTFAATRVRREQKTAAGLAESRRGRNAAQVIANLGVAAFFSSRWGDRLNPAFLILGDQRDAGGRWVVPLVCVPALAALAEATADTVSSEIGQAFGGRPRMLTTLRAVPPGTDGAVTLVGTAAGIGAAAVVAASAVPAMGMSWREAAVALGGGVAGLFFDSLLGATVERRGWVNNDLVNLISTAFAAVVTLPAVRWF